MKTKTIKVEYLIDVPKNFTGIAEFLDGTKYWFKEGNLHREDGPAIEHANGIKEWFKEGKLHREDGPSIEWSKGIKFYHLEDKFYLQINLKDYIVLDSYQGKHNLTWYKLLGKDKVIEYPDIPGLIEK